MSETVRNDVSIESICTVIENTPEKITNNNCKSLLTNGAQNHNELHIDNSSENETSLRSSISEYSLKTNGDSLSDVNCDTTADSNQLDDTNKKLQKIKKSVSFDPNDEKVRKFTSGDPIVDQKNPFKSNGFANGSLSNGQLAKKNKKTPPPVPTKRSTLSVRKTVTQQLREREREKEKEKERIKNEDNKRRSNLTNGALSSPEEFITTEEVLKESKYVKTYIKNPDPYFVYDPTILARLKFEELRELSEKKPPKKLKLTNESKERVKDLRKKTPISRITSSTIPYKKCSKPNYPDLSDIKIKTGTDSDGEFFNPAEVTKNAKKFDERVKKLHIGLEDDLDDIEEPLTKSESSDEVGLSTQNSIDLELNNEPTVKPAMSTGKEEKGTFTNTIKSKEFQEYLEKKGLTLIPKKIPNGAQSLYTANGVITRTKPQNHISFKAPESVHISLDTMDSAQNQAKKPSVFQRLLANSIFSSRRRTTPKDSTPNPRPLQNFNTKLMENGIGQNTSPLKRVVLERQSYHGRPRASNLLSPAESSDLKQQIERSRRSYTSGGDDISLSISSALTNAEYMDVADPNQTNNLNTVNKPVAKPPRRTLSRDRLSNSQQQPQQQQNKKSMQDVIKPRVLSTSNQSKENIEKARELSAEAVLFRRSLERSSMIPKRASQVTTTNERRQMFGRSSSMDRNEILKRSAKRDNFNRSISVCETQKSPTSPKAISKEDEFLQQFKFPNGPKLTSTPVKNALQSPKTNILTPSKQLNSGVYVDLQGWERLRAMKERTDKELYNKVLQQQQQRLAHENIYERLPGSSQVIVHPEPQYISTENNFLRGSPQRNTFSGITRGHRQAKIIDGKALLAIEQAQEIQVLPITGNKWDTEQSPTVRCQSALDGLTTNSNKQTMRRGYESDNETPVILRRRQLTDNEANTDPQRRIGGLLTRDEILQKVKEFCRKSMNRTPTMQAIYEKQPLNTDFSPVSYVSVETHQRPMSRMFAAPQVPQRMHSLPQRFVPIIQEARIEGENTNPSPIYAHVIKRSSLQSNQSNDLYDMPQQQQRPGIPAPTTFVARGTLPRPEGNLIPVQYVVLESEQITPHKLVEYQHPTAVNDIYIRAGPQQSVPGSYGYITVRDAQTMRPRLLHDGRSTPLILDRSSQQTSQIYWTPQHQRLQQQHTGLLPVHISPRYTSKQPATYAMVPANGTRTVRLNNAHAQQYYNNNIPINATYSNAYINNKHAIMQQVAQQQEQQRHYQQYSQKLQHMLQQQQQQQNMINKTVADCHAQNHYEWESGSEGEVQRIMEQQRKSGEFKTANILANLKLKLARFWQNTQR